MTGSITDVAGILVGNHHRIEDATLGGGWATGTTVVVAPPGTIGAVDVRGGAPGTRETDLLDPSNSVQHVDAIVLTGGSAFGLAAADGVMTWLEEHDRGVKMPGGRVPIVPGAVIFDLPGRSALQRVPTLDPLRGTRAHVEALLDASPTAADLIAALQGV